jgi:hypothetical protein
MLNTDPHTFNALNFREFPKVFIIEGKKVSELTEENYNVGR